MSVISLIYVVEIPSITPSDVLDFGSGASSLIKEAFDQVWIDLLTKPGIYTAMVNLGTLIALVSLGFFLTNVAKKTMSGDMFSISEFVWVILVITLLSNQGALLAKSLLALREVSTTTEVRVSQQTSNGLTFQKAVQKANVQSSAKELVALTIEQCRTQQTPELVRECTLQKKEQFRLEALKVKEEKGDNDNGWLATLGDYWDSGVDAIKDSVVSVASYPLGISIGLLFSILQMAFQWSLEIAFILMAMIAPIAVGASLLPTQSKALIGWFSGFFAVSMAKIGFTIVAGIAASVAVTATDTINPIFLTVFLGLFAPVLALIVASGSGTVLFVVLSSISSKLVTLTITYLAKQAMNKFRRNRR